MTTSPTPWRIVNRATVIVIKDADGATVAQFPLTGVSIRARRLADARMVVSMANSIRLKSTAEIIPLQVVHRAPLHLVP
jgi:hypothetical protein